MTTTNFKNKATAPANVRPSSVSKARDFTMTPVFLILASFVQPFKFPAGPYEYKETPLRECTTPEILQQCEIPDMRPPRTP
jgi:hypothetical protein